MRRGLVLSTSLLGLSLIASFSGSPSVVSAEEPDVTPPYIRSFTFEHLPHRYGGEGSGIFQTSLKDGDNFSVNVYIGGETETPVATVFLQELGIPTPDVLIGHPPVVGNVSFGNRTKFYVATGTPNGLRTIYATVRDVAGNESTSTAQVLVDNVPPTLTFSHVEKVSSERLRDADVIKLTGSMTDVGTNAKIYEIHQLALAEDGAVLESLQITGSHYVEQLETLTVGPFTDLPVQVYTTTTDGSLPSEVFSLKYTALVIDEAGNQTLASTEPISVDPVGTDLNGVSSVLFLPGIKGSRLYENVLGFETKRWEPGSLLQSGVMSLEMNTAGQSRSAVYTKSDGVIANVNFLGFSVDFYRTFFAQLQGLVSSGGMSAFVAFPYDWRVGPQSVVEDGVQYNTGRKYLKDEVVTLAAQSKTGKVTIVGHSNGGLVAKALMQKLERDGLSHLVDKVVLIDTPQLGTPLAAAALLHGDFQNIPDWGGLLLSKANARALTKNMPGAHALLPSTTYFDRVAEPVIDLTLAPKLKTTSGMGDNLVDTAQEFTRFITNLSGRAMPARADIEQPEVLSATLIQNAQNVHTSLDAWTPPPGVEVIQIAGWGIETPSGIQYVEKTKTVCLIGSTCAPITILTHLMNWTSDGDETVVTESEINQSSGSSFFLDLPSIGVAGGTKYDHGNITEAPEFQDLFTRIATNATSTPLPSFVSNDLPDSSDGKRLRLRVLSPVSLEVFDSHGRRTGMVANTTPGSDFLLKDEEIPGSYYEEFGEGKYIGLPADGDYTIKLDGYDTGTFTFEVALVDGESVEEVTTYADIPVTSSTLAELSIHDEDISSSLALDTNGDSITDTTITEPESIQDPVAYISLIKSSIVAMSMAQEVKDRLLNMFSSLSAKISEGPKSSTPSDIAEFKEKLLKNLREVEDFVIKRWQASLNRTPGGVKSITQSQAEAILNMTSHLRILIEQYP